MTARAMTLLEVLAATALLALLTGVCVGLVRDARVMMTADDPASDPQSIARARWLAEAISNDPHGYAIPTEAEGMAVSTGSVTSDFHDWIGQASWTLYRASDDAVNHAWLELQLDGVVTWTALILDDPPASAEATP